MLRPKPAQRTVLEKHREKQRRRYLLSLKNELRVLRNRQRRYKREHDHYRNTLREILFLAPTFGLLARCDVVNLLRKREPWMFEGENG